MVTPTRSAPRLTASDLSLDVIESILTFAWNDVIGQAMPEKQMYVAGTDTLNLQKTTPPKTCDMIIYHKIPQTTDM